MQHGETRFQFFLRLRDLQLKTRAWCWVAVRKRTKDLEEKALGLDATNWLKEKLEGAINGDDELAVRTELVGGMGKYGRLLGWLYIGDAEVSLNEQMITEGYAWAYDGGTKQKNFEELREIRRSYGTLVE